MKPTTFYNTVIALGYFGSVTLFSLIETSPLPWWKWVVAFAAMLLNQFGCFAWRDKQRDKEEGQ